MVGIIVFESLAQAVRAGFEPYEQTGQGLCRADAHARRLGLGTGRAAPSSGLFPSVTGL